MDNDDPVRGDETLYRAMLNTEKLYGILTAKGSIKLPLKLFLIGVYNRP